MLGAFISILGTSADLSGLYGLASSISTGRKLDETMRKMEDIGARVDRLSDDILMAPKAVTLENTLATTMIADLSSDAARTALSSAQSVAGSEILSAAPIILPDLTIKSFRENPWDLLFDVRPANLQVEPRDVSLIPIQFEHHGTQFVGWQTRGALPTLFNIRILEKLRLVADVSQEPSEIKTEELSAGAFDKSQSETMDEEPLDQENEMLVEQVEAYQASGTSQLVSGAFMVFNHTANADVLWSLVRRHSAERLLLLVSHFPNSRISGVISRRIQTVISENLMLRSAIILDYASNEAIFNELDIGSDCSFSLLKNGRTIAGIDQVKNVDSINRLFERFEEVRED